MAIEPLIPEHQRHLIIPCKHEGVSFYAFVDVDYTNKQFIIAKTHPEMRDNFHHCIPFERITDTQSEHKPLSDSLCEAIELELVDHFKKS